MVGIPWEQHIAILEDRSLVNDIKERFKAGYTQLRQALCYSLLLDW